MQIPRKLHLIWVGTDNPQPKACIRSWRLNHPGWEFKLWTDEDLHLGDWINKEHLDTFARARKWPAVADLMRYEILYREGGVYVDADSFSLRPLDNWLLENEMFAAWEDTLSRARLINNAFLGSVPHNPFLAFVIEEIKKKKELFKRWSWSRMRYVRMGAWRSVGPYHLTKCINNYRGAPYNGITILPSQMFSPKHFRGNSYTGNGIVYADHQWGTTKKLYTAGVLNVDFSRAGRQSAMAQNGESSPSSSIQFAAQ
jgi:mannosyltransferase OCH1-like enzyme